MFTLAQYVFGIGKSETLTDENFTSNDTAYFENDDPNLCVQTDIENDWILIEIEDKNSKLTKNATKGALAVRKPRTVKSLVKHLKSQEESWFVEPPECFKNPLPDSHHVKSSSMENLLIEHPSMSVFDNLFIKRMVKLDQPIPKNPILLNAKKLENGKNKENTGIVARYSKVKVKPVEPIGSVNNNNNNNTVAASNQNKALTATIKSSETFNKKKSITKKNYERKNKVAFQRNGPIIRHKKMFAQLNGVYHNRNNC